MNMLKSTTALALAIGLGMGLTAAGPVAAGSGEKASTSGAGYEKAAPAKTGAASTMPGDASSTAAPQSTSTIPGGITAEELVGRNVVNRNGDNVGEVESLVIQPKKNEVHAVISVGGFLGMGDHNVAIPLKELAIGDDNVTLMSQQTKEDLKALPEYEEDQWEMWSGPAATEPQDKTQQ